jgi:hypothetical protein
MAIGVWIDGGALAVPEGAEKAERLRKTAAKTSES